MLHIFHDTSLGDPAWKPLPLRGRGFHAGGLVKYHGKYATTMWFCFRMKWNGQHEGTRITPPQSATCKELAAHGHMCFSPMWDRWQSTLSRQPILLCWISVTVQRHYPASLFNMSAYYHMSGPNWTIFQWPEVIDCISGNMDPRSTVFCFSRYYTMISMSEKKKTCFLSCVFFFRFSSSAWELVIW